MTPPSNVWADVRPSPAKIARWVLVHTVVLGSFVYAPVFTWTSPLWLSLSVVLVSCVGVSVGMHRGLIHGAFQMAPWFKALICWLCCLAGMGGPSSFVQMHRDRDWHQDQPTCPYFFGYQLDPVRSYLQMVFCVYTGPPIPDDHHCLPPSDGWMRFLDRIYLLAPLPYWAVLWGAGGWNALWWAGLLPWMLVQNLFWASNYLVHTRGYVTYPRPGHAEQGYNQRLLGLMSFGEGFHNNHHQYPGSARMGLGRYEIDLGYWVVRLLAALGIIWEVRVAPDAPAPATAPVPTGQQAR